MKDWERAQIQTATLVGGKVTPGSGNGRVKGDVIKEGFVFEVKQTAKKSLSIRRFWLNKLILQAKDSRPVFVIFFELRGYAYILEPILHNETFAWENMSLKEENLPLELYSNGHTKWKRIAWSELRAL